MEDLVNSPSHYVNQSASLEPIDVLRTCPFDLGNCIKYIIRAEHKGTPTLDYAKASKYLGWAFDSKNVINKPYMDWYCCYGILICKFKELEVKEMPLSVNSFMIHLKNLLMEKAHFMEVNFEQVAKN